MRTIDDVLKQKEAELQNVQREIDALRLAIRLCNEADGEQSGREPGSADSAIAPKSVRVAGIANERALKQFP